MRGGNVQCTFVVIALNGTLNLHNSYLFNFIDKPPRRYLCNRMFNANFVNSGFKIADTGWFFFSCG